MSRVFLDRCIGAFASDYSENRTSEVFRKALDSHLNGAQSEAIVLLSDLLADYTARQLIEEGFETRHLIVLARIAHGSLEVAEREASSFLEDAIASGRQRWQGIALADLASVNHQQGHSSYGVDLAGRAKGLLASSGIPADLARACYVRGACLLLQGDLEAARTDLHAAVSLARITDEPLMLAMASRRLALLLLDAGRYGDASDAYAEALRTYQDMGANRRVAQTHFSLAVLAVRRGDLAAAKTSLQDAHKGYSEDATAIGHARWVQVGAWIDILEGYPESAIRDLARVRALFVASNVQRDVGLCDEFLGDAYSLLGDEARALACYDAGSQAGRQVSEFSDITVECLRKLGDLHVRRGDAIEALRAGRCALRLTRKYHDRLEIAAIRRLRGLVKIVRNRRRRGVELLQGAWTDFERMGANLEAQITAQLIAHHLAADNKHHEASVWRQLGGPVDLPTLRLYVPGDSEAPRKAASKRHSLESLATQAAEQGIVTRDPRMLKAFEITQRGAAASLPLLIFGETGTGKELLAAVAHRFSGRPGAFVPINCAALPPDLLDAELFGHTRGAYTGALRDRPGLIEAATDGTLFLDEIGEMSLPVQGRLLRAIELGEIRRLGENRPRKVNTRFVGATHRDLSAMVRQGMYRPDLFFRLRGIVAVIPPLRERPWDVDVLIDHFLAQVGRAGGPRLQISPAARERLRAHPWPGNVRELKSMVERLATMPPDSGYVGVEDLDLDPIRVPSSLEEHLEDEERRRLLATLESVQWNRSRAAHLLNLKRTTLVGKLRRLGIAPPGKK
jgi:two-component system response regulator AtoC